jgi:hypothetical protein
VAGTTAEVDGVGELVRLVDVVQPVEQPARHLLVQVRVVAKVGCERRPLAVVRLERSIEDLGGQLPQPRVRVRVRRSPHERTRWADAAEHAIRAQPREARAPRRRSDARMCMHMHVHVQHHIPLGTRWISRRWVQGAGLRDPLDGDCIGEGVARWR